MSQPEVAVPRDKVHAFLTKQPSTQARFAENLKGHAETLTNLAVHLEQDKDSAKVDAVRNTFKTLLGLRHNVQVHSAALGRLQTSYTASLQFTDFEAQLDSFKAAEQQQFANFRLDDQPEFKDFEAQVRGVHGPAEAANEDDDDVVVAPTGHDYARNRTCPITAKPVLELDEPVEDQLGFVYEKQSIEAYIRSNRGSCPCPVAATSHTIKLSSLTKATKVLREQRRQRHVAPSQRPDEGIVLDV